MADCIPVRIAKAVEAELNAAVEAEELSQTFSAAFSFGSEVTAFQDLNDDNLKVDVVPTSDQQCTHRAGSMYKHNVRVAVGIRRRIAPADRTDEGAVDSDAVTSYVNLLYEFFNLFAAGRKLTSEPGVTWDSATPPTITLYDPDMIKDGLYFGWIHLPFILHERATA